MSGESSPVTLRQALEAALAENPDDLAAHMAYADHLMEQGDPRGEFIQVQLALESAGQTTTRRDDLRRRAQELALAHHREWLGAMAEPLLGSGGQVSHLFGVYGIEGANGSAVFARGWLDRLHIKILEPDLALALVTSPQTRLLRQLTIDSCRPQASLAKARFLGLVRILHLGTWQENAPWAVDLVRGMPRLDDLRIRATGYRVIDLLRLPVMEKVRVLALAGMTDLGCQWLSHSAVWKQLRVLDLSGSSITDAGARFLATAPDLSHLDRLDICDTEVSPQGRQRVFGVLGSKLRSDHGPDSEDEDLFDHVRPRDAKRQGPLPGVLSERPTAWRPELGPDHRSVGPAVANAQGRPGHAQAPCCAGLRTRRTNGGHHAPLRQQRPPVAARRPTRPGRFAGRELVGRLSGVHSR
jgi:uncharacterized protein (TIGR02996 family)